MRRWGSAGVGVGVGVPVLALVLLLLVCAAPAQAQQPAATVNQLMRGLFFPASNVVFAAQLGDPEAIPRDLRGAVTTDLLRSVFGGWDAVENSALAIMEAAPLLLTEGRACSNGRPSPVGEAEWRRYVEATRAAASLSATAARAKSQDLILDATGQLSDACSACHRAYRGGGGLPPDPMSRCAPRAPGQGPVR